MRISTEIGSIAKIAGLEKSVELCGKAGFDAWDFSMFDMRNIEGETNVLPRFQNEMNGKNYLAFARKLKQIGLDNGIVCNQAHAPFPPSNPQVYDYLFRAIECAAEAGADICVVHPFARKGLEENAAFFAEILPFAKSCGVKIATENMWDWDKEKDESSFASCATGEDFKQLMDLVNDPCFVACLDLGHAEMRGSGNGAAHMIRTLGHHLKALHIHDNDRWHDSHQIPFSMQIDFEEIAKALKQIDYQGDFTLEADQYLKEYTKENVLEGVIKLKESGAKFAQMFQNL